MSHSKPSPTTTSVQKLLPVPLQRKEVLLQEYVCERVFKEKSPLCRLPFPYVEEVHTPPLKPVKLVKKPPQKRKPIDFPLPHREKPYQSTIHLEKVPINEYLSYDLSEQINYGLKEAKQLADQIKSIKIEKRKEAMQGQQRKAAKKVRIRRTNFKNKKDKQVRDKHSNSAVLLR